MPKEDCIYPACCNCGQILPEDSYAKFHGSDAENEPSFSFVDEWMALYEKPVYTGEDSPALLYLCPECVEKMRQQLNKMKKRENLTRTQVTRQNVVYTLTKQSDS